MSYSKDFALLGSRKFNVQRANVAADIPSQEVLATIEPSRITNRNARRLIRKAQKKGKGSAQ